MPSRPAASIREGDHVVDAGRPQAVVAVRHLHRVGTVRIITADGDVFELAAAEPVDTMGAAA